MNDPHKPKVTPSSGSARVVADIPSTMPVSRRADLAARRLLVIVGDKVSSHPLPDVGEFRVGRGEEVDLRIDDPSVSRDHAVLTFASGKPVTIRDNGSSNGTRVRGKRLGDEAVTVPSGETFEVGSALLMIQAPFTDDATAAAVPSMDDSGIVIGDRAMTSLYQLAERIAMSTINVLLLGETGVGKDVLARRIHEVSPRADKPFLPLNCGALTEQLLESELFGHEKGAFTWAVETKLGLLESADEGTVFLDEVGELPLATQVKLLRVLEERQVRRVGGLKSRPFDIRFIAATNRDLNKAVADGSFRADLFYRLNGISLVIPPLRKRVGEIEELARKFIATATERAGRERAPSIAPDALAWLMAYAWPGNIRELQNTMERAVLLCTGERITIEHLPVQQAASVQAAAEPAEDMDPEKRRILDALEECAGNQTRAAKLLGISRNTLLARLDSYGIARPRKR